MAQHGGPAHETPTQPPIDPSPSDAEVVPPKYWHELTDEYVSRARQEHSDLSGLLIDIDATKAANDELGHEEGTRLIDMVDGLTALIPRQVRHDARKGGGRPVDVITSHSSEPPELEVPGLTLPEPQTARIGGDEFGILLPRTDAAGAVAVRDRLYGAINEQLDTPEYEPLRDLGVGVSIGIATLDPSMKTASDFLRAIDRSMYAVKIDQVPELSAEGLVEFAKAMEHLRRAEVRPRDVPKYLRKYGATALSKAFEDLDQAE
jgi:GGDEF domain-containing protein